MEGTIAHCEAGARDFLLVIDMTSAALARPSRPSLQNPLNGREIAPSAWLVLIFGLSMFVLLTFWAKLNPALDVLIVNDKRIFATGLGALVYWLTIRRLAARSDRTLGEMIGAALAVGIPGTALILVARELFDLFTSPDGSEGIARNIRWLLLWLGYYGAWVAGFVAVRLHRYATAGLTAPVAVAAPASAYARQAGDETDWLLETIVDELAAQPGLDRLALSDRLLRRAGYEQAEAVLDRDASGNAARRELALRLAARLSRQRR